MSSIVVDSKSLIVLTAEPLSSVKSRVGPPSLSTGEILSAQVFGKTAEGKYLLTVKNFSLEASSQLALKTGDQLELRVAAVRPQIILTLADSSGVGAQGKIREGLMQFRANPDALLSVFSKIDQFAGLVKNNPFAARIAANEMAALVEKIGSLILTSHTKADSLFVKNFVETGGMMLESILKDLAQSGMVKSSPVLTNDLKTLLFMLSGRVAAALKDDAGLPAATRTLLQNLALFTAEAIKALEARQIVNVSYQQNESGLYLQIPVGQADGLRRADVFIRPDGGGSKGEADFTDCSITIFLDMERLGKLAIEARLRRGNFHCVISCEQKQAQQQIDAQVHRLWEALAGLGYSIEALTCRTSPDLEQKHNEFLASQLFSEAGLINFFV
ncbi:MAG TPA: flagellar hook-length control protein FliK [Smithellaceae bacterium]|nr:flagellar hook-length control protein FliK [Smithellaceae bacterium]